MTRQSLDLTPSDDPWIGDRILGAASPLFDAVKAAPLAVRSTFPNVLRNNNFGLAVYVTRKYAFLEVTTKFRAQRSREHDRLQAYRQLFTTSTSGEPAVFALEAKRLIRIAGLSVSAPHAFAVSEDSSLCAWDVRNTSTQSGKPVSYEIDVLYFVSFGRKISAQDCWQEFDSLIRVTISDWSGMR